MSLTIIARQHLFDAIDRERDHQDRLHPGTSRIPDGTGGEYREGVEAIAREAFESAQREGRLTHAHVFDEETAEVLAETDPMKLRTELIQVAAVCVKWIEEIERRSREP